MTHFSDSNLGEDGQQGILQKKIICNFFLKSSVQQVRKLKYKQEEKIGFGVHLNKIKK